jgi:protein TonB
VPDGRRSSPLSRRVIALFLIACLHASVIYILATGLLQSSGVRPPDNMEATLVSEPQPQVAPAPVVVPKLVTARVEVPHRLQVPDPAAAGAIETTPTAGPAQPLTTEVPKAVSRIPGGPAAGFPNAHDYYPQASRRMGEQGIATVQVCVDARGRLTADPTLAASSGSSRLDEASLRVARAGSGHYRPTTENARPVSACYAFRIRFKLQD